MSERDAPRGKKIFATTVLRGREVTIYGIGFTGDVTLAPDRVVIGDRDLTDVLLRRGWVDLDELEGRGGHR